MKTPGIKELVKSGKLGAKDALNRLWAKSDTGMGGTGHNILKQCRTFKWLSARIVAQKN